jgi:hypothetical protein
MASNPQTTATWILLIFSLACLAAWWLAPGITEWSKTAGVFESTIVYILTNPVYLAVFLYLSATYHLRGFLASLFVILAVDIQSLPHVVTDGANSDPSTFLFIDSIIARNLSMPLWVLYTVVPIGLMVMAYEITAPGTFVRVVKRYVG